MIKIFHNPRCSKSRQALALLSESGVEHEVILYLETPPNRAEITKLAEMLGCSPRDMMRRGELIYKELGLAQADDSQLFDAMASHPILIERPIIISGKRAVIARPPERVEELL